VPPVSHDVADGRSGSLSSWWFDAMATRRPQANLDGHRGFSMIMSAGWAGKASGSPMCIGNGVCHGCAFPPIVTGTCSDGQYSIPPCISHRRRRFDGSQHACVRRERRLTGRQTDLWQQLQAAFDAAAYHAWRANAPITCYEPVPVDYRPTVAGQPGEQAHSWLDGRRGRPGLRPPWPGHGRRRSETWRSPRSQTRRCRRCTIRSSRQPGGQCIPSFDSLALAVRRCAEAAAFSCSAGRLRPSRYFPA